MRLLASHCRRKRCSMSRALILMPLIAATLSGCGTASGKFPSLSRRPFEGGTPIEAPIVAPVPVASSLPDTYASKVAALTDRHARAAADYAAKLPGARKVASAAAGAAIGSEAWVNAHVVVSRLDHARADSVAALGALDNIVASRFDAEAKGAFPSFIALLTPVQADIARDVAAQNAEIQRLSVLIGL